MDKGLHKVKKPFIPSSQLRGFELGLQVCNLLLLDIKTSFSCGLIFDYTLLFIHKDAALLALLFTLAF